MTTLYISGAITNVPDWRERFAEAEERLRAAGYECVNPADHACSTCLGGGWYWPHGRSKYPKPCPDCPSWAQYVKAGIVAMLATDGVATISGPRESKGANIECYVAIQLDMPVMPAYEWIAKAAL